MLETDTEWGFGEWRNELNFTSLFNGQNEIVWQDENMCAGIFPVVH